MSIYIVQVREDDQTYNYEYGNLAHARSHYNQEKSAMLFEYSEGKYYLMDNKAE